jgi:hypothetical protein
MEGTEGQRQRGAGSIRNRIAERQAQGLRDRAAERDSWEGQRDSGRGGLGVYGTERHRRLLCHCPSLPLTVPVFVVVQKSVPTGTRRRKNKKRRIAGVTGGGVGAHQLQWAPASSSPLRRQQQVGAEAPLRGPGPRSPVIVTWQRGTERQKAACVRPGGALTTCA